MVWTANNHKKLKGKRIFFFSETSSSTLCLIVKAYKMMVENEKDTVYLAQYKYLKIELDKCDGASVCKYCSLRKNLFKIRSGFTGKRSSKQV